MQPNPGDPSGLVPGGSEEENLGFRGPVEPRQVSVGRLAGLSSHVGTPRSLPWTGAADGGSVPRSPRRGRPQPSSPGRGWGNTRERAKSSEAETKLSPVTHNWWNICSNFSLFFFFPSSPQNWLLQQCQEAAVPVRLARLAEGCAALQTGSGCSEQPGPGGFTIPCLPQGSSSPQKTPLLAFPVDKTP